MKTFNKYIIGLAALSLGAALPSCQNDFDDVKFPAEGPTAVYNEEDVISIYELKKLYWQDVPNYIDTIPYVYNDVDDITGEVTLYPRNADGTRKQHARNFVIKGRVISSDVAGNVYKKIVIQDETAAMAFSVNRGNMSSLYNYGQEIVVNCNGLYLGKYNGGQQFGYPSWYESQQLYNATFMPYDLFASHIQLNGMPDASKVRTIDIASVTDLSTDPDAMIRIQSNLARFHHVYFVEGGEAKFCSAHKTNTNRMIRNYPNGDVDLIVRTSGYSKFWDELLPKGEIDLVALVDYYQSNPNKSGDWQLTLNGLDGILSSEAVPGSKELPYTIEDVINFETEDPAPTVASGWMTGYIVGAVAPDVEDAITSNDDIEWAADTEITLANTLVIGPTADCKDFSKCVVVSLVSGTELRAKGNLVDHPENAGKQIWLNGNFEKYMGTWGITGAYSAAGNWEIEGVSGGTTPDTPSGDGNGTEASPYSVAQVIKMNPTSTTEAVASGVWVEGYIVGSIPTGGASTVISGAVFGTDNAAASNMVVAPTADCTDYTKCIAVALVSGSDARKALNLMDNPGNLGKKVEVFGDIMKYCGGPGVKNTSNYKLDGAAGPDQPSGDGEKAQPTGEGTAASPYNVSKALDVIAALGADVTSEAFYVTGKICELGEFSADFGNYTYKLSDDGKAGKYVLTVYRGKYLNGDKFTAADQIKVGDVIVLNGTLVNFKGNTPEVNAGSKIISINGGSTTPNNPDQPSTGKGSKDEPYTCADVLAGTATGTGWAEGYIVGWIEGQKLAEGAHFDAPATSATNLLIAASASEKDVTKCVPVQLPTGAVRKALNLMDNPGNLGKVVKLNGSFEKYFGVAGIKTVTEYVIDGQESPTPDPTPDPTGAIYSGLVSGIDGWTIDNVNLPAGIEKIWSWNTNYNCLYGTAYKSSGAVASEAYIYTTVDLSAVSAATLTFEQAAKFQTTLRDLCGPVVRVQGTTTWTRLSVPTWCEAGTWDFTASGDISLNAYAGKKIEIGFVYASSTAGADSWEIKNFVIK